MTNRPFPVLRTARLVLRPRTPDDAETLFPAFADVEAMRYWSSGPHDSVEQTRTYFENDMPDWRSWAITLAGDDRAIGFVSIGEDWKGNVSEIGYMLLRAHWRTGIVAEAVSAVIEQAFAEGQRRLYADTDPDNAASRALLEGLGFKLEGVLRAEWETHIGVRDTALYGLLPSDWSAARAKKVERARRKVA